MIYSESVWPDAEVCLTLQTPLVVIRWILVVLAALAWLIVVPILELVAAGYRTLARSAIVRRLRGNDRFLQVAAPPEGPSTRK
jgi:hypothetical protein